MPRPIDLVGKRVVVTLSEAADHTIDGQELEGAILRLAPDQGLQAFDGVIVQLDDSVPARYRNHQVFAMPRLRGEPLDSALQGNIVPVNFWLRRPDGREVQGIGSLSVIE